MTTSPTPWTSKLAPEGHTIISDAAGSEIGTFKDWQNADAVLEEMKDEDTKTFLRAKIEELDNDIEAFEEETAEHKKKVERLEKELEALKPKEPAK